jgi:hypothetical protein
MAVISTLSVGQALDKLRGTDAPSSKMTQLDSKIDALDKEMQLLRATSHRVEHDQRAASTRPVVQDAAAGRSARLGTLGIAIGLAIVILILAWQWLS